MEIREEENYVPNKIPTSERVTNIIVSVLLLAYGTYGIKTNDLFIPGKRTKGIHLHDVPAWVMYGAFICACLVMLSVVADHYDNRNNERIYQGVAKLFKYLGWGFFILSLVICIVNVA